MTFNRGAQRAMIAVFFAALSVVYAVAWSLPAIGLDHDDAANLVTAKAIAAGHGYIVASLPAPIPQTNFPPLFPAVLALFTLVSRQTQWLKVLPLACTAGWLAVDAQAAAENGRVEKLGPCCCVGLTAASPTVVFLSTNLLPETLFALLATAALLTLLEERALLAGLFAGTCHADADRRRGPDRGLHPHACRAAAVSRRRHLCRRCHGHGRALVRVVPRALTRATANARLRASKFSPASPRMKSWSC